MTLQKVGRYKFNKKLASEESYNRTGSGRRCCKPITGEVVAENGTKITRELEKRFRMQQFHTCMGRRRRTSRNIKILSNMMVDLQAVVDIDPEEVGVTEQVYYPVLAGLIEESAGDIDELKESIRRDIHDLIPKHITKRRYHGFY